tara:strand:+ start:464 stop:1378 length:915 start_codon:yes stop_codon:yes gene_type:complete
MGNQKSTQLEKPSIFKTVICLFGAAFMWASSNVISRSLLIEGVNEIFLVTARVSIIGSLLFTYYLVFNREKINIKQLKEASFTGFFSIFIVGWSFIFSLQYISSGLVTLMISSAPVFTVMWLKILLKEEKISTSKYIAIATGFSGIAYLFISRETGLLDQGDIFLGGSLAFVGVQGIAFATVLNRKYAPKYKVTSWLTYQYPLVLVLSLVAFFISGVGVEPLDFSQKLRLLILVVFNLGAFMSFTWLIQRVSALLVATVDYLVPIIGVTAGVVFLNEVFNRNIIISGIFIFISLVISTKEEFAT